MQTRFLAGAIESFSLPSLLLSLQAGGRTGRLRLDREGVRRDLYLRSGQLVAAGSSAQDDALEWMLFRAGAMTEDRHAQVRARLETGARRGPALVETGGVSPGTLCAWTETHARYLASDALSWTDGSYEFEEGAAPPAGSIVVKISPGEILLASLREGACAGLSAPPAELVLEPCVPEGGPGLAVELLQPQEAYVLSLADGRRSVLEICELSEFGPDETLRNLAVLTLSRCLVPAAASAPASAAIPARPPADESPQPPEIPLPVDLPAGESTAEIRAVIRVYNDLYMFVYAHMIKEVGPIAEQLLEKHLREVRDLHAALFHRAVSGRDGSLPEDTIMRNANLVKDQNRRDLVVGGMHGYLRAMVLAVRRILGPGHETQVVRRLRELRCTRI